MDEVLIRAADEEDTCRILELVRGTLGEGSIPRSLDYWLWKHSKNPFGPSPILVAEAEGRLVGLRVFMCWKWQHEGRTIPAVRAVDTATHPDWQGKGIFTRLTMALVERMTADGIAFVFNTPNDQSRPGYLKMGWTAVGRSTLWIHPRRPIKAIRRVFFPGRRQELQERDELDPGRFSLIEILEKPELERVISAPKDTRLTTSRTREYLKWRYADVPGFRYRGAAVWGRGDDAVVIFRMVQRGNVTELRFCEILSGHGKGGARAAGQLMRSVFRQTTPDYAAAMAAPATIERRALLRAGFVPAPRIGPILTVRPLAWHNSLEPTRWSSWRLSIGDLELF